MSVLLITGTRGIPARYGGFETFVQEIAPFLAPEFSQVVVTGFDSSQRSAGIQSQEILPNICAITVSSYGWRRMQNLFSTIKATRIAIKQFEVSHALVLNDVNFLTAIYLKIIGSKVVIHLDGDESIRRGIPLLGRLLHRIFRWLCLRFIDSIILDSFSLLDGINPRFHHKISVIKYGASVEMQHESEILDYLRGDKAYLLLICRMVPENNVIEIVKAVIDANTDLPLHLIGMGTGSNSYENQIRELVARHDNKIRLHDAMYDKKTINTLLKNCVAYLHGHEAGGTNPILVSAREHAPIIFAHDNKYNRESATNIEFFWSEPKSLIQLLADQPKLAAGLMTRQPQANWADVSSAVFMLLHGSTSKASYE